MDAPLRSMVGMVFSPPGPPGLPAMTPLLRRDSTLDLIGQLAERADRAGRHLAASGALVELHRLGTLEDRTRPIEEAEEEVVLGARRGVLHPAQDFLVRDRGRPLREGTFLDDVVDLPQEGKGCGLALGQPVE